MTDLVHSQPPYAQKGRRTTSNAADGIYRNGGDQLLLTLTGSNSGYSTEFAIALDLSNTETGRPDGGMPGGRPGTGPPPPRQPGTPRPGG